MYIPIPASKAGQVVATRKLKHASLEVKILKGEPTSEATNAVYQKRANKLTRRKAPNKSF